MGNDRKLVYSTVDGSLAKPMERRKTGKVSPKHAPVIHNPAKQGVRIRRESKGRGGKSVCVISGLPLDADQMKRLLKKLKGQLGCGGAVKGAELEIQGDHREKLLELLEKEGFKARLAGG